jgi:hypothetical protein
MAPPFDTLIVPGFTPRYGWRAGLHPKNAERLARAHSDLALGLASHVIVSGAAVHSADVEAELMCDWLVERGVARDQILVEPYARNTTTNLRNAGRMMLERSWTRALVVTSDVAADESPWHPWSYREQSFYVGYPWRSTFHARCLAEFGYLVGELAWLAPMRILYRPSPRVLDAGWRETR